jgi:hypothetical protein
MGRYFGHARKRADDDVIALDAHAAQRQRVDVDQPLRTLHLVAHQIDERRAARDIPRTGSGGGDRFLGVTGFLQGKGMHDQTLPAASEMASTMP